MKKTILFEIKTLENAIARRVCSDTKNSKVGHTPTPMQEGITVYLMENQDKIIYQKDLEVIFKVRKSSISGVLQTMEKKGIIQRIDSETDKRTKQVVLTEKTKKIHNEIYGYFSKIEEKLTNNISKEKLDVFYEVIGQMINNIEE